MSTLPEQIAADYAADGGPRSRGDSRELAQVLSQLAQTRGVTLQADARLDQLAAELGAAPERVAPRALEFAARQLGLYDPQFAALTRPLAGPTATSGLNEELSQQLNSHAFTHYGAAVHERDGQPSLTVVLSLRRIRLDGLPKSVALGAAVRLRASLPEGLRHARVELIHSAGRVVVPVGSTRELSVQLKAAGPGLHRITVIGEGAQGDELLAKLPIYVDEPFPSTPADAVGAQLDRSAIAQRVLASINRARARAELSPLRRDVRLDSLAAQHNTDMRVHAFTSHTSPRSGNPTERVARAGLPTALVLETITRAVAPGALEANAEAPAGELRNWLSPSVTHVGIDVMEQADAFGPWLVATELFVDLPERIEPASAKPQLLSWVNAARVQRGASTIALDAGLCALAAQAAERFVSEANATEQSILADTDRELSHFSLAYRRVHSLLVIARRLEDAASVEPGLDPEASGLGIGIAQGERGGRSVLAVVMLVGTHR